MTHWMPLRPAGSEPGVSTRAAWLLAAGIGLFAGCTGAPVPVEPPAGVEAPDAFSRSGVEVPSEAWWTELGDAQLSEHVARALAHNRELESLWHTFREACAVARRADAGRRPMLDLFVDGSVARGNRDRYDDEEASVGAALDWELDVWGRIAAGRQAEVFEARARLEDYRAAAVTLTAEVARTWVRLLEAEQQVAVLDEQIAANEQILSLIEPRVAAQDLRSVDLLRQETLIESRREARIDAQADAQVLRNQLALLTGRPPGGIEAHAAPTLAPLPPLPSTGVPIESVRRRPDVRAARRRVLSGDQELAAALRDRFPRLNLQARAGSAAGVFEGFISSFAAGLLAPVIDGGQRSAEIARARAQRDRLRADYAQSILVAFREVEDALVEEERERRRLASLERQLDLTQRSSERLRDEYLNGQGSYIDVLSALTSEQELRRELLTTQRRRIEARIGLHRALAGSPWTPRERKAP